MNKTIPTENRPTDNIAKLAELFALLIKIDQRNKKRKDADERNK